MRLFHTTWCAAAVGVLWGLLAVTGAGGATVPSSESFESYANGYSISSESDWTAAKGEYGVDLADLAATIGDGPQLTIEPVSPEPALTAGVHDTRVVWSYASSNHFKPFVHVRYDTTEPVETVVAEFALKW